LEILQDRIQIQSPASLEGHKSASRSKKVGDVVHAEEENAPRLTWLLGRVVSVCRSPIDGVVRAAYVQVPKGKILRRFVKHFYPMEVQDKSELGGLRQIPSHPTVNSPVIASAQSASSIPPNLRTLSPSISTSSSTSSSTTISNSTSNSNVPAISNSSSSHSIPPLDFVSVNYCVNDRSSCSETIAQSENNSVNSMCVPVNVNQNVLLSPVPISSHPFPSSSTFIRSSTPVKPIVHSSSASASSSGPANFSITSRASTSADATADSRATELQPRSQLDLNDAASGTGPSEIEGEVTPHPPKPSNPSTRGRARGRAVPAKERLLLLSSII
jgi:Family of unknown function (DUF5641)